MMKASDAPASLRQSLRNRPSRLLYEPPAKRHGNNNVLKSPSTYHSSSDANLQPVRCKTDSKNSCLPKPTEFEGESVCGSKPFQEQKLVAYSKNSPSSLSCQEDLGRTSYQRLKPIEDSWLSERKPGLGRGRLLKLQLLYEHKYFVADEHNVEREKQNCHDEAGAVVCAPNLDKTDYQLSNNFNNNNSHVNNPFLKVPVEDYPSHTNEATPQQIENGFEPFVSGNSTCQENLPLSIEGHDDVRYVLEEAVRRLEENQVQTVAKSFVSGDCEPKTEASKSPGFNGLLPPHHKSPITQNKFCSLPDSFSQIVYNGDSDCSFSQTVYNNNPDGSSFSQTVSDGDSDHSCSQAFSNGNFKGLTNIFCSYEEPGNEEPVNVLNFETSSLSDETYITVSSHLSDAEENDAENINRSTDSFDKDSLLSESNSWMECLVDDSSSDDADVSSFKTSFIDDGESLESSLCFQENSKEEVMDFVGARERINHFANYQAQENTFNQNTPYVKNHFADYQAQENKFNQDTTYVKDHSAKSECTSRLKLKLLPETEKYHTSDLSASNSTFSSWLLPNSDENAVLYPSATNYKTPTSTPAWKPTAGRPILKNWSFSEAAPSPVLLTFQSCNKNITRDLTKHISCERVNRSQRPSWSGSQSNDCLIDSLRSRVKDISFRNQDHWNRSPFQFQRIFDDNTECWKVKYKKKCSEAGNKFLDTHCHIDMMFNEHLDRIYGTFQEYRVANADSFPTEFAGCVAIFCNPLTFNPRGLQSSQDAGIRTRLLAKLEQKDMTMHEYQRLLNQKHDTRQGCTISGSSLRGSLFRSLVNEGNIWIAVGCHPKKVRFLDNRTFLHLNMCIRMPQVVAVGEIGLDYSGMFYLEAEVQKKVFRTQIKLALDVSKPIVIHCRDAEDDCFNILKTECPSDWLIHLHCYMLDFEHARKWLDTFPNLYIGLTPRVTYRSAFSVRDTAQKIPLTRLVLESDAPYFIPRMVPHNQLKCSHPGLVFTVAETVAQLQGRDVKEVLKACWDNSLRLYRIQPDA